MTFHSRLLLPADAVAALRTRSAELTLPADVGAAQRTCSPPKLLLSANVVAATSSRPKMTKAVSGGRTASQWPRCIPVFGIVVRLHLWYEFDSDARQHPRADVEPRYAHAQSG